MKKINFKVNLTILLGLLALLDACTSSNYDDFAKCLAEKNVKMYGAFWCPHCANQKEIFGGSFQYVNYIECSLPDRSGQTEICKTANIKSYPTWEFSDNSRQEGEMQLSQLSRISGCQLQKSSN